jgi:hypothetical protein
LRLAGSAAVALLFAAAGPLPGSAQPADPSARAVKPSQDTVSRPARKPAKPAPRAVSQSAVEKPWTLENALPDHSSSLRQYDFPTPQPKIGRVPLQSGPGTVGFETETKTNAYRTPDGRTIPGLEAAENRPSSYVGLSLSVPTNDKMMNFPVPLLPLVQPPQ